MPSLCPSHVDAVQRHLRCPHLPLTLASAVGSARALPDPLVAGISGFLTRNHWIVEVACRRGDLQPLQRVIAVEAPSTYPLYRSHAFSMVLMNITEHDNAIELLECLRAYFSDGDAGKGVEQAISYGKVDVLEWISANLKRVAWNPIFALIAVEEGYPGVMLWLKKTFPERDLGCLRRDGKLPREPFEDTISVAFEFGFFELAKWLHAHTYQTGGRRPRYDISKAVSEGRLDIFKWLVENSDPVSDSNDMDEAAARGHMETLIWLHENSNSSCSTDAMARAAAAGKLDVVRWLHGNRSEGCTTAVMDQAAWNGRLQIVKWLHENHSEGCSTYAMDWAAGTGCLGVIKWLHENRSEGCTTKAMDNVAKNNHLHVVKWLRKN